MIPLFGTDGFLPAGVHAATLDEIRDRFGHSSEIRRVQMESVVWMVDLAVRAGVERIILNGSFTTNTIDPNDAVAEDELVQGLPFLDISLVGQKDFDYFVHRFFAADRMLRSKGMIEVVP